MNDVTPTNDDFFRLFTGAVEFGIGLVRDLERRNIYIGSHHDFRRAYFAGRSFPAFTDQGLKDYSAPFGIGDNYTIDCKKYSPLRDFIQFAMDDPIIGKHFGLWQDSDGNINNVEPPIAEMAIINLFASTIDMYLHKKFESEFSAEWVKPWFWEIERAIFDAELEVDVVVPILSLDLELESSWLVERQVAIFRMNQEFHEARAYQQELDPHVHWIVARHASHAFMFKGLKLKNRGFWQLPKVAEQSIEEQIAQIDFYFALLKTFTGKQTGYAQVLLHPVTWSYGYVAHLPKIIRRGCRSYPPHFDRGIWLLDPIKVKQEEIGRIGSFVANTKVLNNKRIQLALSRLNYCFLREREEDRILDVAIGLEALFGDDEKQEMTHKLALRIAAISRSSDLIPWEPIDVFQAVKTVYSYRSKVAHGKSDSGKYSSVNLNNEIVPTTDFAVDLLRKSIAVLGAHPNYLDPAVIDKDLLIT